MRGHTNPVKYTTLLFGTLALGCSALCAQETPLSAPVGVVSPPVLPSLAGTARILGKIPDGTPPPPAPPKPPFVVAPEHVRDTTAIQQGGRTITLQRIDPIALPPPPAPAAPLSAIDAAAFREKAAAYRATHPWVEFLALGATVYRNGTDPARTFVRYRPNGGGEEIQFWSSADFSLLASLPAFTDGQGRSYSLFLMWTSIDPARTVARLAALGRTYVPPQIPDLPGGAAAFTLIGSPPADARLLAPIRALHEIYNSQYAQLQSARADRERARLAREAELKAHPPQPQDLVIRHWRLGQGTPQPAAPTAPPPRRAAAPQPRRRRRRTGFQPVMENGLPACCFASAIRRHLAAVLFLCLLAPNALAILDTNNDGMSDLWQTHFNAGNVLPGNDDDNDGWTNAMEATAGTNPFDANPPTGIIRPAVIQTPPVYVSEGGTTTLETPAAVSVTWPTVAGKLYTLRCSPDMSPGSWLAVDLPRIGTGTGPPMGNAFPLDSASPAQLFFAVAVEDLDQDQDGLTDAEECRLGLDPTCAQTIPGYPDLWLATHFSSAMLAGGPAAIDLNADPDLDGLTNAEEWALATNPHLADTDGDGVSDGEENGAGTSPLDPASCPFKVVAALPDFKVSYTFPRYYGHRCGQPVVLYLNQPLPGDTELSASWMRDLNGQAPVPAAGTTVILPGRQAVAFIPAGDSFAPWLEEAVTAPSYELEFTTDTTGLEHVVPFGAPFTITTAAGSDGSGPWVGITAPGRDFIDTAVTATLTAGWSEPLDPASVIPANVSLVPDGGAPVAVAMDFDYSAGVNRLSITPTAPLAPATRYTVTLGTGFHNLTGKAHAQPVSWSFTTRPLRPAPVTGAGPYVTATSPADFAFGITPPTTVTLTFSEDMDPATLTAATAHCYAGNGAELPGTFTYSATNQQLVFQPAAAFAPGTYHQLRLDAAAIFNAATEVSGDRKALQGNPTFVFATAPNFTTGDDPGIATGVEAPTAIAPLMLHYGWGEVFDFDEDSGCRVDIKLIDAGGALVMRELEADTEALEVAESGPIAPATTVVITPEFVPGTDKDEAEELPENGIYVRASDAVPPPGMTYLVFRKTPPASGGSGPATVEYLGPFGGTTLYTAACADATGRGPQSLYLVPVPVERELPDGPPFGWRLIEGDIAKALPGQKMNLRLEDKYLTTYGPGGVTLDTFSWTVPDKAFKDYVCVYTAEDADTSGTLTLLAAGDLNQQEAHFYWADSGTKSLQVGYQVRLNGAVAGQQSAYGVINIENVVSTFPPAIGKEIVTLQPGTGAKVFGLFSPTGGTPGIRFIGCVTTPAGYETGKWNWVQLVKSKRQFQNTTGTTTSSGDCTAFKLDTYYPYCPFPSVLNTFAYNYFAANGVVQNDPAFGDTPQEPLENRTHVTIDDIFEIYLMFKPAGTSSRYVPLRKADWRWGGVVSSADNWAAVTGAMAPATVASSECSDHPQWTGNTTADDEQ